MMCYGKKKKKNSPRCSAVGQDKIITGRQIVFSNSDFTKDSVWSTSIKFNDVV